MGLFDYFRKQKEQPVAEKQQVSSEQFVQKEQPLKSGEWQLKKLNIANFGEYVTAESPHGGAFGVMFRGAVTSKKELQEAIKSVDIEKRALKDKSFFKPYNNLYDSIYACPYCGSQLWKTVFQPNNEYEIFTNDPKNHHVGIKRVFTCSTCYNFYSAEFRLTDGSLFELSCNTLDNYKDLVRDMNNKGQSVGRSDAGFVKLK